MTPKSFVTHLEAPLDKTQFPAGMVHTTHEGRPICVGYDLERMRRTVTPRDVQMRPPDMWRYRELLPVGDSIISLGEVMTPIVRCPNLARHLGLVTLYIKDESRLPTGSFKARGMAVAISMARQLGIGRVALPSAGNAGGAAAAYAARAGMECFVFMPADAPEVNRYEARLFGARVYLVDGHIGDCGKLVEEGVERMGWFNLATLREPYRLEGKKTMGFELAEQLGWTLPDAIFYPTGGGTGLIGMWKAFGELSSLRWLKTQRYPRLFACQSSGCAPLAEAFAKEKRFAEPVKDPHTIAAGIGVPSAIGDFLVLDAVRGTNGEVLTADESRLREWMERAARLEGISLCPESAACLDALETALATGSLDPAETVLLFNTAAAQKYVEVLRSELPALEAGSVDWDRMQNQ